jgi:cytochrome P450
VRPNFARSQVADLDTFETHIKHLIQKLPRDGSTIDIQPYFFQLTFDSATEFLFGESVEVLLSPEGSAQKKFAAAFDYGQSELITRSRLGPFLFFYKNPQFDQACKIVHNFVDRFVYKALEERRIRDEDEKQGGKMAEERYVFLNELAKSTKDPKQLRDELLNILLAGRDTTAGLLSNTFHAFARRPDVWRKLKAEVDELGGKAPDYDTLRNMKYLKNVLNECEPISLCDVIRSMTKFKPSSPTVAPRSNKRPLCQQKHHAPPRWWPGWQFTYLYPQGASSRI